MLKAGGSPIDIGIFDGAMTVKASPIPLREGLHQHSYRHKTKAIADLLILLIELLGSMLLSIRETATLKADVPHFQMDANAAV
ncbi:hypothetical protein AB0D49_40590 [Streptomyces sp. NPDC048290]|uniref:hypothetical protein n=1 Tax=Streptomyces sp. NPDC048290 TaxID=3155811 RepID=UPI00342E48FA